MFQTSIVYEANWNSTADIVVNQGGTWSGKTYSINQVLFSNSVSTANTVTTITGQDIPNLKRGALRDAQNIVAASGQLKSLIKSYNASDRIYTMPSGGIMEFTSYGNAQDAHSGKRDFLFINEANGISWEIAQQLLDRTRIRAYIDYNPSSPFWVHDKLLKNMKYGNKSVQLIISDHRHNPFLTQAQHDHIEAKAIEDPEWGRVYARGMTGKIEGLIFKNYTVVGSVPLDAKLICYCLDFGFTNDPTALIAMYLQNGELFLDELIYDRGLTNQDISAVMEGKDLSKDADIIADSAEPKSIEEIYRMGWNYIEGAEKGPDSIKNSIDILKRYKMNVTQNSSNLRRELDRYKWVVDKNGITTNKPLDFDNHAIDAIRYGALNKLSKSAEESWGFTIR